MPKCPQCKEGDARYGHDFKNEQMLKTHIKFKHTKHERRTTDPAPSAPKAPPAPVPVEPIDDPRTDDPSLADLGLETPAPKEPEAQTNYCSECGTEITGTPDNCPNCGESFEPEGKDGDDDTEE